MPPRPAPPKPPAVVYVTITRDGHALDANPTLALARYWSAADERIVRYAPIPPKPRPAPRRPAKPRPKRKGR